MNVLEAFDHNDARILLALVGRLVDEKVALSTLSKWIRESPDEFLQLVSHEDRLLEKCWRALRAQPVVGRSEALVALARALGRPVPPSEYELPERTLAYLLSAGDAAIGRKVALTGRGGHKGRVGDAVERLLIGEKGSGRHSDHPAAEIKSVPVQGATVIERVKLGVVSARSNPLKKCSRVLFVFVEERGSDHFVVGHRLVEFDSTRFEAMWEAGFLVETAAGISGLRTRGLYINPGWFRAAKIWP